MLCSDISILKQKKHQRPGPATGALFFTTRQYPVYYQPITKCGFSFILNLLYSLDQGHEHSDSGDIHRYKNTFPKAAGIPAAEIKQSPYSFIVTRNPVNRFMSVYFDKFYRPDPNNQNSISKHSVAEGIIDPNPDLTLDGHRNNCLLALDWIQKNLNGETQLKPNFHWRPQFLRIRGVFPLDFTVLTLEGLNWQLPHLLGDLIPDLADIMAKIKNRNVSVKPVTPSAVVNDEIVDKVSRMYDTDTRIHAEVTQHWQNVNRLRTGLQQN